MLDILGGFIEKKPWIIIGFILMITLGFATLIPSLEMETSTEDFLPDNELVDANERITDYFGQTGDIVMILVERQNARNVSTSKALKEEFRVIKELEDLDVVNRSLSLVGFIDMICQLEFGEEFLNCTDQQIATAYNDLMSDIQNDELTMLRTNDPNEKIDYKPYPKLSEGISIDSLDIKNYYVQESVGIATGILITALHIAGLVTLTHTPAPMKFLNKILDRPSNEKPFLILVVGYPAKNAKVPKIKKKTLNEIANFL